VDRTFETVLNSDRMKARTTLFLLGVTVAGVAVCAIPVAGGIIGIIGGGVMLGMSRRDRRWADLHTGAPPVPIGETQVGQRVRMKGRVVSPATVRAPVSGREVVYAGLTGTSALLRRINERKLEPRHLGEALEIEDESGRAVVPLVNVHVLSRHVLRLNEHNEPENPALREIFQVVGDRKLDVEETSIAADDELWVCGTVAEIEDIPAESSAGYRASGCAKRITLGGPDGTQITNLRPEELERIQRLTPAFIAMGATWLAAGAASLGYFGWRLLT